MGVAYSFLAQSLWYNPPMYRYAYLLFSSFFFLLWISIFVLRKDLRKQMLFVSLMIASAGLFLEYLVWTTDWWEPETVTGTRIGIEDVILGVTNGGLGAVLYEITFKRRTISLRKDSVIKRFFKKRKLLLWSPLLVSSVIGSVTFWILGWHSFWATVASCLFGVGVIILLRSDLLIEAVLGGVAMVVVTLPAYFLMLFLFPGVIEKFWLLDNLSGILFWGIPIEDLGFYFAVGAILAPFYEFFFEKKLVKLS
jgi:hypothetical protein